MPNGHSAEAERVERLQETIKQLQAQVVRLEEEGAVKDRVIESMATNIVVLRANVVKGAWVSPYGSGASRNKLIKEVIKEYTAKAQAEGEE